MYHVVPETEEEEFSYSPHRLNQNEPHVLASGAAGGEREGVGVVLDVGLGDGAVF